MIEQVVRTGQVWSGCLINRRKNGEEYHAAVTAAPVCDENGKVVGIVAIERDVSNDILCASSNCGITIPPCIALFSERS